ncbi:MAG TPA: hydrogenase maturation nickel metallochaperone HypA [Gemmatimonadota bacterium]|jgi:hydrogenase nickel incorporation protein HypA/HybF
MHELSIADSIVRIAESHAQGRKVMRVDVVVGHLRQVVPSALSFNFELVAAGTPVAGAELVVDARPARVECGRCGTETEVDGFPFACGACGGFDVRIVQGEELFVESIELEDSEEADDA